MKKLLDDSEVSKIVEGSIEVQGMMESLESRSVACEWNSDRECFEVHFADESEAGK